MTAIQKIREEHRSISAVLHGLKQLARDAQNAIGKPGFEALRAMVCYIDQFPEQLHHPKEDRFLFEPLVARLPDAWPLVDALKHEHGQGARLVRELERALVLFEERWPAGGADFRAAVDAYAEFHWNHMRKEEHELLPLAEKHFLAEDWRAADAAFGANADPIAGVQEKDFDSLFTRIVSLAPAPIGVGEPWKKARA